MHGSGLVSPEVAAWTQHRVARIARHPQTAPSTAGGAQKGRRRLLLVHLDGVPRQVLETATRDGTMPFLGRLIASGAYRLDTAFWGSPASTPYFQAGLLYGLEHPNLPAYHWFDRELGRVVHMNVPRDAKVIEDRLGQREGRSLLAEGGAGYLALFRAQASNLASMTALADLKALAREVRRSLRGLSGPARRGLWEFVRHLVRDTWTAATDVVAWGRQLGGDYRHEREYLYNRLFMITLAWNLAHSRALIDMVRGVPTIYLVFGNYDEVAHRRGPFSPQALLELQRADRDLEELYAFAKGVSPAYDVVFVTDHGHVESMPFERRQRLSLADALLKEGRPGVTPELERALLDGRPPGAPARERPEEAAEVVEAGNFAHVYLSRGSEPLEAADLLTPRYRDVLARVADNRDIGIAALRRGEGAVALVKGHVYGVDELHQAPLAEGFSREGLRDLLQELPHMKSAGDLVLYGDATAPSRTVGFAWEFGSHGGLTSTEVDSVILWPTDGPVSGEGLTRVTQLHERLAGAYRG